MNAAKRHVKIPCLSRALQPVLFLPDWYYTIFLFLPEHSSQYQEGNGMDLLTIIAIILILVIILTLIAFSIRIVRQWERVVVLFLGRFVGIRGPGLVIIIPFLNTIPYIVDMRVITTSFNAEQTLTKDTVPVNVDAVLFWQVIDVTKATLEVQMYKDSGPARCPDGAPGRDRQDRAGRYARRKRDH